MAESPLSKPPASATEVPQLSPPGQAPVPETGIRHNWKGRIGRLGESLAARHLTSLGFRLLARNYRVGRLGEIDLVMLAEDGVTLCFVEVKTRTGTAFGRPAEAVTADKRRRIRRMAQVFVQSRALHQDQPGYGPADVSGRPLRFDVVEVMLDRIRRTARVHHIPQAF